jgi:hypothetical protein
MKKKEKPLFGKSLSMDTISLHQKKYNAAFSKLVDKIKIGTIPSIPSERYGHPKFYELCKEEMDLHSRKNHDYAKGGNPLGNFQRVAKILSLYPGLKTSDPSIVAIVYMLKQLDASLWMLSNGHQAKVEGHKERWQDVSVYSKIISILIDENSAQTTQDHQPTTSDPAKKG